MTVGQRLEAYGYLAGWRVVGALPESVAVGAFNAVADVIARRGGGPAQLRRNLARVLGCAPADVPADLMRASVRSYARYWREAFRLPRMDLARTAADVEPLVAGRGRIAEAVAAGKGAILVLPHSGNWDIAGVWLAQTYGGFATVAERLEPELLYQRFVEYREGLGFEIFPTKGGEQPPFELLRDRLEAGGVICLLGDRDLTRHGVPVTFFGEKTRMPAGPARLAIETGAPLLPVHCWFTPGSWAMTIEEPIDVSGGVEAATQELADRFAANIAAHPADWHMLQPLWIGDWSQERRARIEGDGTGAERIGDGRIGDGRIEGDPPPP